MKQLFVALMVSLCAVLLAEAAANQGATTQDSDNAPLMCKFDFKAAEANRRQ